MAEEAAKVEVYAKVAPPVRQMLYAVSLEWSKRDFPGKKWTISGVVREFIERGLAAEEQTA